MSYARQLLDAYPGTLNADAGVLAATIDALSDCAQACIADADDDLREQNLAEMVTCIRLCWDCADVCTATLGVVTRQTARDASVTKPLLEAAKPPARSAGDECLRHAHHHEPAVSASGPAGRCGRGPAGYF